MPHGRPSRRTRTYSTSRASTASATREITNAKISPGCPGASTVVVVPKRQLLPRAPRTGIVINLPGDDVPACAGRPGACHCELPVGIGKWTGARRSAGPRSYQRQKDARGYRQSVREGRKRGELFRRSFGQSDGALQGAGRSRRLPDSWHQPTGGIGTGDACDSIRAHRDALRHGSSARHDREPAKRVDGELMVPATSGRRGRAAPTLTT